MPTTTTAEGKKARLGHTSWITLHWGNRNATKSTKETYQPNCPQTYNNNMNTKARGVGGGVVGWVLWVPAGRAAVSVRNFYPVLPSVTGGNLD